MRIRLIASAPAWTEQRRLVSMLAKLLGEYWLEACGTDPNLAKIHSPCDLAAQGSKEKQASITCILIGAAATGEQAIMERNIVFVLKQERAFSIVAEDDEGGIAGFMFCSVKGNTDPSGFVHIAYVAPSWRRKEILRQMTDLAHMTFRQKSCRKIWLEVMLGNTQALETWQHLGFDSIYQAMCREIS